MTKLISCCRLAALRTSHCFLNGITIMVLSLKGNGNKTYFIPKQLLSYHKAGGSYYTLDEANSKLIFIIMP